MSIVNKYHKKTLPNKASGSVFYVFCIKKLPFDLSKAVG